MTSIPQDVIDSIVDLLAASDNDNSGSSPAALRACALACTSFLFTVRRHRFRKLAIKVYGYGAHTTSKQAKKLQELSDILQMDPFKHTLHAVVTQIRSLNLNFCTARENTNLINTEAIPQNTEQPPSAQQLFYEQLRQQESSIPTWADVQADFNVVSIMAMLPCVQHFNCSFPDDGALWRWSSLDEAIRSTIFNQSCSPTTTFLCFENIGDFPTGLFPKCQYLQDLRLFRVERSDVPGELGILSKHETDISQAPPLQLRNLHAVASSSMFESILGLPVLPHLVSLRVSMSLIKEKMLMTWRLILSVASSLESLTLEDIRPIDYTLKLGHMFDLTPCRNLRYLGLVGWMSPVVKPDRFPIGMLKLLTDLSAAPSSIDTILINLQFEMMVQGTENLLFSPWTQFDAAFNGANFPCLKTIDISFYGLYMWTGQEALQAGSEVKKVAEAEIRKHVQDALSLTFSTKSLNITPRIEASPSSLQQMFSSGYYATFMQNVST